MHACISYIVCKIYPFVAGFLTCEHIGTLSLAEYLNFVNGSLERAQQLLLDS